MSSRNTYSFRRATSKRGRRSSRTSGRSGALAGPGFPTHLRGLHDVEISSSIKLRIYLYAQILSDFAWGAGKRGKDKAFYRFKNPFSLEEYVRKIK